MIQTCDLLVIRANAFRLQLLGVQINVFLFERQQLLSLRAILKLARDKPVWKPDSLEAFLCILLRTRIKLLIQIWCYFYYV